MEEKTFSALIPTGVPGLDDILRGGLTEGKMYLLSGSPGTGKTTFSLQFITEGISRGERCLYITVGSAGEDFVALAKACSVFLDPDLFSLHSVQISGDILGGPEQRIFHSAEAEPAGAINDLLTEIRRVRPKRLVIDSMSDLRLLSDDLVSYRRLVLAMRRELGAGDCTVVITNNIGQSELDAHLETICHGVIRLEQVVLGYGPVRRRLLVLKERGRAYRSGWHDFKIEAAGIRVFPALIAGEHRQKARGEQVDSGNKNLDLLFDGGLDRGSTTVIIGASGTGKTTIANLYAVAAARRGEHVAVYLFDETDESYRERAEGLGLGVDSLVNSGLMTLRQINVAEFSRGEFTAMLIREVEENGAQIVVIDTLSGYASAMPDEKYLIIQLHELLTYLCQKGVTTILTVEQHGLFGSLTTEVENVSYLADSILLIRFFELRGEIRRAISVVKRRRGKHEKTIRELTFSAEGIVIGNTLLEMQGVLTGVPILGV